ATRAVVHHAAGTHAATAAAALRSGGLAVLPPVVPWELAIKVKAGKLELPLPPLDYCLSLARRHRLTLPREGLDAPLLCAAAELPLIHRDPFDRILVALAIREHLAVLTPDRTIPLYPVSTIW
ncbi:MAG: type II toxin-antitoxin system VapC family toxin, partial [Planctomycetia bacterium]